MKQTSLEERFDKKFNVEYCDHAKADAFPGSELYDNHPKRVKDFINQELTNQLKELIVYCEEECGCNACASKSAVKGKPTRSDYCTNQGFELIKQWALDKQQELEK